MPDISLEDRVGFVDGEGSAFGAALAAAGGDVGIARHANRETAESGAGTVAHQAKASDTAA